MKVASLMVVVCAACGGDNAAVLVVEHPAQLFPGTAVVLYSDSALPKAPAFELDKQPVDAILIDPHHVGFVLPDLSPDSYRLTATGFKSIDLSVDPAPVVTDARSSVDSTLALLHQTMVDGLAFWGPETQPFFDAAQQKLAAVQTTLSSATADELHAVALVLAVNPQIVDQSFSVNQTQLDWGGSFLADWASLSAAFTLAHDTSDPTVRELAAFLSSVQYAQLEGFMVPDSVFQQAIVLESVSLATSSIPRERPITLDIEGVFRPINASDSDSPNPTVREVAQIYGSKADAVAAMNEVIEPALIADTGPQLATETRRLHDELSEIASTDAHVQTTVNGGGFYQLIASPVGGACKGQAQLSFGLKLAWQSLQPALDARFEVPADLNCLGCLDVHVGDERDHATFEVSDFTVMGDGVGGCSNDVPFGLMFTATAGPELENSGCSVTIEDDVTAGSMRSQVGTVMVVDDHLQASFVEHDVVTQPGFQKDCTVTGTGHLEP